MVSSLILMNKHRWTYKQLFEEIHFNLLTRASLGLFDLEETPFNEATIFNFQNRVSKYFAETGVNLLELVFDRLTNKQIKQLKIKTDICRTDSFLAASNIRNYSRLQLLIEMIIRLYRILDEKDKQRFQDKFLPYINKTSGQYIYNLNADDIPHELEKVGEVYRWIATTFGDKYKEYDIFHTFERVYLEHFKISKRDRIEVIPAKELSSSIVQSPDDLDATYRKKRKQKSKGQSINIVETANPKNELNLITDVVVNPNNKDDSKVINERIEKVKEKTAELDELHYDGAYGNKENDKKLEDLGVTGIQTGIRGRKERVPIEIEEENGEYIVSCPEQSEIKAKRTRKRYKAEFDKEICLKCPLRYKCPTIECKRYRVYYFDDECYERKRRRKRMAKIPEEKRKIRSNIEATVKEFTCKMPNKKLKVRGMFKTALFAFTVAIGINFGRIYRLSKSNPEKYGYLLPIFSHIFRYFVNILYQIHQTVGGWNLEFQENPNPYIFYTQTLDSCSRK
jgi:hypothetical protein